VAVDAAGNVYIADAGNGRVVEVPVVNGALSNANQGVVYSGTSGPAGLSVDAGGNLYIADSGNNKVWRLPNRGGIPDSTLAAAIGSAGDRAAAMSHYSEALRLAEKLCVGAAVSEEDWMARADAHRGMAAGEQAMGRGPEAMAELRLGIADYEKVVARNPRSKPAQQGFSASWSELSAVYYSRRDYRQAVDAALKALPFLEAEYAAGGPGDRKAVSSLYKVLTQLAQSYAGLGEYDRAIEAGRRSVEIAGKMVAAEPTSTYAADGFAWANIDLGSLYGKAGRRDESIASYRRAWEALDRFPMEKLDTPLFRAYWAVSYGEVISDLDALEKRDGLAALGRRAIAVLEPIYQAEPGNPKYRFQLLVTYDRARNVLLGSGQIGEALEIARKAAPLYALASVKSASFWARLAYRHAQIGSFHLRLGQSGEAAASWGTALDDFKRSREEAAKVPAADAGNAAALGDLRHAELGLSVVSELTGSREEALRWAKEALTHATAQLAADPRDSSLAGELGKVRAMAVRLQWLISGEKGDYRSLFGREATPGQIRAALAAGWVAWAGYLGEVESPWPARVEALRTVVDLYRQNGDSTPAGQVRLASAIAHLGHMLSLESDSASGADKAGELREAAQVLTEARDILAGLDRAGTLPASIRSTLANYGSDLAAVNAKLTGLVVAAR